VSKLEYMIAIAYYLGKMDKDDIDFDLETMDIEDLTTLCGVILDEFYTQNETAYISEFLYGVDAFAVNEIYHRVI